MDLKTGKLLWSKQLTENDAYNTGCTAPAKTNCPEAGGQDFDFGQPPILVRLGAGKRALVIGQKSGMVHAVDPDQNGKLLWQTRAGEGSALGGSQWGSAADGQHVYVAISDIGVGGVADPKSPQGFRLTLDPNKGGGLHALDLATGKIAWSAKPAPCADGQDGLFARAIGRCDGDSRGCVLRVRRWAPARVFDRDRRRSCGTWTPSANSRPSTAQRRTEAQWIRAGRWWSTGWYS